MPSELMFLTFTSLTEPSRHHEYNEWHQLDHLPENLALPGVAWGDRWVRSPDCAQVSHAPDPAHRGHQYAVMYWFRPPLADSLAEWRALNQRALWWGRRPEIGWTRRAPAGFFEPVTVAAAPRVRVGADAVRFRPHRGIHLSLSRMPAGEDPRAVTAMAEYDRRITPAVLEIPGVAGVGIYRSTAAAAGPGGPSGSAGSDDALLVRLVHLDADPVACTAALMDRAPEWLVGTDDGVEEVLFSSPMRTIAPGEWDWFPPA
jgi:hypothetical protein